MTRDRMASDELPLTQELLTKMLSVHRPTVSEAAEGLRERGPINCHHGRITITNRAGLEGVACADYQGFRPETVSTTVTAMTAAPPCAD